MWEIQFHLRNATSTKKRHIIMSKLDLLKGIRVLEELDSPVNGKLKVVQSLGWGISIQADNLTQSGGVLKDVWGTVLKKVSEGKKEVRNSLILGLGAGSAAKLVKRYWQDAKVTGVEIDPLMIDLGMKYLGLSGAEVDIKITDAYKFCKDKVNTGDKYDLILNDIYVGSTIPSQFEEDKYVTNVRELMVPEALAIFNRLYYGEKRGEALSFGKKLEKHFSQVHPIYPEANVMFVCRI
jgi:spermidine synthase